MWSANSYIQIHMSSSSRKNAAVLQDCKNAKCAPALSQQRHCSSCPGISISVRKCKWGMRDWDEPERMPKSGLLGVCLVKCMASITKVVSFKVLIPNKWRLAVYRMFAAQSNAVRYTSATHPHQHFSHFHVPHSAFAYRCGHSFTNKTTLSSNHLESAVQTVQTRGQTINTSR